MNQESAFEIEQAMAFLKTRILAQAAEENVRLSAAETATLTYSEPKATLEERELADKVDAEVGATAYERKITSLIRSAYRSDVARGAKAEWDKCLRALRHEDRYVLVMVRHAGLSGGPAWYQPFLSIDMLCIAAVGIAGLLMFFTRAGSFLRSDLLRAAFFVVWIGALWALGEWSKRRAFRTRN